MATVPNELNTKHQSPETNGYPAAKTISTLSFGSETVPLASMIHEVRNREEEITPSWDTSSKLKEEMQLEQNAQHMSQKELDVINTAMEPPQRTHSNFFAEWQNIFHKKNQRVNPLQKLPSTHPIRHGWTPDRGPGWYGSDRERQKRPSLVAKGANTGGNSRVIYTNKRRLIYHSWVKDSFISALNTPLKWLLLAISFVYIACFFFFAAIWWGVQKGIPDCITSINGFANAYIFSMVTQQTIGYGNNAPNDCYWGALIITVQTIVGLFLDSITLGIIFARISHPKNRGRTIGISDSAVISRRDGILKLMFRIADFRETQVVEPNVRAYVYMWGKGRTTIEGEHIPCRIEPIEIHHIDGMLLVPIIIEHTIDERSPLCGHTHDTLTALNAEIVVTFEGTTEMGNPFMARQSYLPSEIKWGHQFAHIIRQPVLPSTRYMIQIERFHDVEPQEGLELMPPGPLSEFVCTNTAVGTGTVPWPLLGENTLVLSNSMIFSKDENGDPAIMFRVADTYPAQHLDVQVRAYLYRWQPNRAPDCGKPNDMEVKMLEIGYEYGDDRVLLFLPWISKHVITAQSPLANWLGPNGMLEDSDSMIAVTVEGYMYCNSQNRMRMKIYHPLDTIKKDHAFEPIVSPPWDGGGKPRVDWLRFHSTRPLPGAFQTAEPKQAARTFSSSDPTVGVTNRYYKRDATALSKVSFVLPPDDDLDGNAGMGRQIGRQVAPPFGGRIDESGAEQQAEIEDAHAQDTVTTNRSFLSGEDSGSARFRRSHPPESMFMLTPANDPDSTFAQRPIPPHRLSEHTFMTEAEAEQSLGISRRNSLGTAAKESLSRAFSNLPLGRNSKQGPDMV